MRVVGPNSATVSELPGHQSNIDREIGRQLKLQQIKSQ